MPIRNMWSLECGEVVTAEAVEKNILKKVEGTEIYFPLHDTGVDLLVVNGKKHVSIQVKESRIHEHKKMRETTKNSWYRIHEWKFKRDRQKVDFYIFLTYLQTIGKHKFEAFEKKFIVIPTSVLETRLKGKSTGVTGIFNFKFIFQGEKVIENNVDYSMFLDKWDLIIDALKS